MKIKKQKRFFTKGRSVALAAALLLAISALLPWGYGKTGFVTGMKGDGIIVISISLIAFLFLFIKKIPVAISLLIAITGFTIGITVYNAMTTVVKVIDGQIGFGLYLTISASILMIFGIITEIFEERKNKKLNLYYADEN